MNQTDPLVRTKLHRPFTRPELVSRPRLQALIAQGLCGPLTLITAPAGFGKTTLVASCIDGCGIPVAWLSLDKDDNHLERFLNYLIATIQEAGSWIGSNAVQLLAPAPHSSPEAVLTNLINELDTADEELALVLDDYQFINNQSVHDAVSFLLEHCPKTFHLVIVTRSDPRLPLTRLRARGQAVELRAADLRFTEAEAALFLNEIMGLSLYEGAIAILEERTEGWIAGLQMAALSMRDREDVLGFIEGFSGTNRYIMDYLLEDVLASQPPEIQRFLLHTSILERLTAPLCDAVLANNEEAKKESDKRLIVLESLVTGQSASILEYLERANLFLVPLDDERIWFRYHHLFADLLRNQLQNSLGSQVVARLHLCAAEWLEQNGLILEAIQHASIASEDEMVESLIEQHYMEMVNRSEMSWVRYWMGTLSKELIYRRPWLCLYEALSRSWFGQLDEASVLLNEAEKLIRVEISAGAPLSGVQLMMGYHDFVKSRVTAMQGDTRRAIEYCRSAREKLPADNLSLQNEFSITLGYEYFLYGDFVNASQTLLETIQTGYIASAVNNPVAAYALLARAKVYQGRLHEAHDLLQKAARLIQDASGQYHGATGLVEVGIAALLCEWNDLQGALDRVKKGLDRLPWWGKADDFCLAYTTLSRIQLALGNQPEAESAIEKAAQLVQTCGLFSEARSAVETTQIRMWLLQRDWPSVDRWVASNPKRLESDDPFGFENELAQITQARKLIAQNKPQEAIGLLSYLEDAARSAGRMGRLIEVLLLKALAMRENGDIESALQALTKCLELAEPEGYARVFLDEGKPMQRLLVQWLAHAGTVPVRDYAGFLLSQLNTELDKLTALSGKSTPSGDRSECSAQSLLEPLSQRELEVLQHIALGRTNQEIARQLVISPGTVKAHTSSIYGKLDVSNRTEAVARARQLGLLS